MESSEIDFKPQPRCPEFHPGSIIQIHSLTSSPQLNGQQGVCNHFDPTTSRWQVQMFTDEVKCVKQENLEASQSIIRPGLVAQIHSLENSPELNGQEVVCERLDLSTGRWQVSLDSGVMKSIKPANLQDSHSSFSRASARSLAKIVKQSKYPPRSGGSMASSVERTFPEDNPTKGRNLIIYTDIDTWCGFSEIMLNYLENKKVDYLQKRGLSLQGRHGISDEMARKGLNSTPQVFLDGEFIGQGNAMQKLERYFPTHNPLTPSGNHPLHSEFLTLFMRWQSMDREHQVIGYNYQGPDPQPDHFLAWVQEWDDIFGRHPDGPWLLGPMFTWLDAVYVVPWKHTVFNAAYNHNFHIRRLDKYPNINRYLNAMDARPEYQRMRYSDVMYKNVTPLRHFPTEHALGGGEYRAMIQGTPNGESYMWPLAEERTAWGIEPGGNNMEAAIQAGHELLANLEKVARFALRSVENDEDIAPLYQTRQISSVSLDVVCNVFVLAVHILLRGGIDACPSDIQAHVLRWAQGADMKGIVWVDVWQLMLTFCRKIGTPRDMSYPAVRQLRASILWVVNIAAPNAREDAPQKFEKQQEWYDIKELGQNKPPSTVQVLDIAVHTSVRQTMSSLSAGTISCPQGFCCVYSQSAQKYILIYKPEKKEEAFRAAQISVDGRSMGA